MSAWFYRQIPSPVPIIGKIQNAFIAAMNDNHLLPRFVVVILDKDLIVDVDIFDCGAQDIIYDNVDWLLKQIAKGLLTRRKDLKSKNIGAVDSEPTRVIWVKMLTRPVTSDQKLARIWKLKRKFNKVLEDRLQVENFMHLITVHNMDEHHYFDVFGQLTNAGLHAYWSSLDQEIKELDQQLITAKDKSDCGSGRFGNNPGRKLPTLPPCRRDDRRDDRYHYTAPHYKRKVHTYHRHRNSKPRDYHRRS